MFHMTICAAHRPFIGTFMAADADLVGPGFPQFRNFTWALFVTLDAIFQHLLMLLVREGDLPL